MSVNSGQIPIEETPIHDERPPGHMYGTTVHYCVFASFHDMSVPGEECRLDYNIDPNP
jgi:hypothetical protein